MDPYKFISDVKRDDDTQQFISHTNTANPKETFCHALELMQTEQLTHTFTEDDWYAIELTTPDMPDVPLHPNHHSTYRK